jgi:hypothetical protein
VLQFLEHEFHLHYGLGADHAGLAETGAQQGEAECLLLGRGLLERQPLAFDGHEKPIFPLGGGDRIDGLLPLRRREGSEEAVGRRDHVSGDLMRPAESGGKDQAGQRDRAWIGKHREECVGARFTASRESFVRWEFSNQLPVSTPPCGSATDHGQAAGNLGAQRLGRLP